VNPASIAGSLARVRAIARVTWLEAVRQRFFSVLLLIGVGGVASGLFFREFNFGVSELKFIADFGFGGLTLFGSIVAIVGTAQLFFSDIDNRTVYTVLAKPVHRGEFLAGKFLGAALVLGVFVGSLGLSIGAVLAWREQAILETLIDIPDSPLVSYATVASLVLLQAVKLALLAAITLFVASYARTNLFTVVVCFVVLVICHLQPVAQEAWRASAALFPRVMGGALALIFPNFQLFTFKDGPSIDGRIPVGDVLRVALYGIGYTGVVMSLAIFSFSRREL